MDHDNASRGAAIRRLLSKPPFRLLWAAVAVSSFGDQFFVVALPWLVLQLSHSDAALGSLLMVAALPRSALMLVGGALSDRMPPGRVLERTRLVRACLIACAAALVIAGRAQLWHLYPLAIVLGVLDALSGPASSAIVPRIAGDDGLNAANSVTQSTGQVSALLAPIPAGALISFAGIGATLVVSAVASALSGGVFALMRRATPDSSRVLPSASRPPIEPATAVSTIEVLRVSMRDPALRAYLLLIAALSLATSGPIGVGIPSLALVRFDGSVSLGIMLSASGGGTLVGTLLAGSRQKVRRRGALLLGVNAVIGVLLILLAYAPTVAWASLAIGTMTCGATFVSVVAIATLQAQTHRAILGRLMSIVMLASVGLAPVSYVLAGFASGVDPALLFGAAGALVIAVTGVAAIGPALRALD